jgi:hypothetical protein
MKTFLLTALSFLLISFSRYATDESVPGIYVTKNNDTLACRIIIPRDFGRFNEVYLFSKVSFLDSLGNQRRYTPNDINGYAFFYRNKKYVYVSRQVEDDGSRLFLWPLNLGRKINEYYHYTLNSSNLDKGSMNAIAEVYVLENAETKETISLMRGGTLTDNYRAQMRRFFENDKTLLAILAKDVKQFHDISRFVKDANRP